MNLYDQYLALLQMFFHHQDNRPMHQEKHSAAIPASDKELFRDAA